MSGSALVLGGGGVTGIAWELGMLLGLADAGIDLIGSDRLLGTSAGSVVAVQVTSGAALADLFDRQIQGYGSEIAAKMGAGLMMSIGLAMMRHRRHPDRFRRQIGTMALDADTVSEDERLAVMRSRLPSTDWPDRDLRLTAIDTATGELRVFTRADGVPLVRAVAASCAVPGVWPAVTIDGRRYMDGGMRSPANADLAEGCPRIVVIAPLTAGAGPLTPVAKQVEALRAAGSTVTVISPDKAAGAAIGSNPLDPSRRAPAAKAGRAQAVQAAALFA